MSTPAPMASPVAGSSLAPTPFTQAAASTPRVAGATTLFPVTPATLAARAAVARAIPYNTAAAVRLPSSAIPIRVIPATAVRSVDVARTAQILAVSPANNDLNRGVPAGTFVRPLRLAAGGSPSAPLRAVPATPTRMQTSALSGLGATGEIDPLTIGLVAGGGILLLLLMLKGNKPKAPAARRQILEY